MACLTDNTLAAYLDGRLPAERQGRLRSHLESCPSCRSLIGVLQESATAGASRDRDRDSDRDRDRDPLLGKVLADSYEVLERIGAGGMSTVYAGRHLRLDRRVAIKVLSSELRQHGDAVERFAREARVCAGLGSPHIAQVFDFNQTIEGTPYMVIELLKGEDLAQRLALDGPLAPKVLVELLGQACDGLGAAHAEGIVHRDIKPSNLFLCDSDGETPLIKLLDFGISKIKGPLASLTGSQQVLGTPCYMSPEMATGRAHQVDARADLFSLGAVAYEALSGTSPFAAESIPATLFRIAYEEPTPLSELRPDLSAALHRLVAELLQKEPAKRPESTKEVKDKLAALQSDSVPPTRLALTVPATSAAPSTLSSTPTKSALRELVGRRLPLFALLIALCICLGAAASVWWYFASRRRALSVVPSSSNVRPPSRAALPIPVRSAAAPSSVQHARPATRQVEQSTARPDAAAHRPRRRTPPRRRPVDNDPLL